MSFERGLVDPAAEIPFVEVAHRAGRAWRWQPQPDVEIAAVSDVEQWTRGLYLSRGDDQLAVWSDRPWDALAGWVPMLLVVPDGDPFTVGNTIVFPVQGSAEHGCDPETWVFITFELLDDDAVGVTIEIEGMPYLALPTDGQITALNGAPMAQPFPQGKEELVMVAVSSLELSLPWGPVVMTAAEPIPWLQLQGQDDFTEVDADHSCEQGVERVHMTWEVVL